MTTEIEPATCDQGSFIGARGRPYTHAPPEMDVDGMPWGAFCRCSRCGALGCSTNVFDFYGGPGEPLVCGRCKGIDPAPPEYSITYVQNHIEDCDPMGPGCRGGYVEEMGR